VTIDDDDQNDHEESDHVGILMMKRQANRAIINGMNNSMNIMPRIDGEYINRVILQQRSWNNAF
jgi:hypothetical protein